MKTLVAALLLVSLVARADEAADFRTTALALAKARKRDVVAWGSLHLDGSNARYLFATMEAGNKAVKDSITLCGKDDCRGLYLVEELTTHRFWLLVYSDDRWGGTSSFRRFVDDSDGVGDGTHPLVWEDLASQAIVHSQGHNHGTEQMEIAMRKGRFVVRSISDDNRSGSDVRTFGTHGAKLPALSGFHHRLVDYIDFQAAGPALDPSTLVEPPASE